MRATAEGVMRNPREAQSKVTTLKDYSVMETELIYVGSWEM